jgi:hypothetical protein
MANDGNVEPSKFQCRGRGIRPVHVRVNEIDLLSFYKCGQRTQPFEVPAAAERDDVHGDTLLLELVCEGTTLADATHVGFEKAAIESR